MSSSSSSSSSSASSHAAVKGSNEDLRKVTRALISVSDKSGLVGLGEFLSKNGVELLSTGGTAKELRQAGLTVKDVSEYTMSPEMLDGRVKTLHPKIHGGILAVRGNEKHEKDMRENGIEPIDMVVLNLYPFEATVSKGNDFETCVENVDIGGPAMLRASAKNHSGVVVVTAPSQYEELIREMQAQQGSTTMILRKRFASAAFALSAQYDSAIAAYFAKNVDASTSTSTSASSASQNGQETALTETQRNYNPVLPLKYGCNPHQKPAALCSLNGRPLPFEVLNGTPGYINLLDAANAWQLVKELRDALGLVAAASFKHVSPAGAAVAVPLSKEEEAAYELTPEKASALTPAALAYIRARNADPMSSFGDFAALSDVVDVETATFLKTEVSDGIVAPGYTADALNVLKEKKGGKFIVLRANAAFQAPEEEFREVFGMGFMQKRNTMKVTKESLSDVKTAKATSFPEEAKRDLVLASIVLKYTQSNSVGYARSGQMLGVGAGQQSRVDCVKLAGRKLSVWWLRQHPKVQGLAFKSGIKRQDRVNARVRFIEGDMSGEELKSFNAQFEATPAALTQQEKDEFMKTLNGVSLSSDAFFPFPDSIHVASKLGVSFIAQPGGSVQDQQVTATCDEYNMAMCVGLPRCFHH